MMMYFETSKVILIIHLSKNGLQTNYENLVKNIEK